MTVPVFEEYEPAGDCGCAGCAARRRSAAHTLSRREGGHPAAHGVRRALVLATTAGVVLGGGTAVAAPGPGGQGQEPAAAPVEAAKLPATTRSAIISRAARWVAARVPYRMDKKWKDGYREDCSGFVSMAWGLDRSEWTGSLAGYGTRTHKSRLRPGDILLFHNPANPNKGSHVTIFGGWTNSAHTYYLAYEQTHPHTRAQSTPYRYWANSSRYVPYRYKGLRAGAGGSVPTAGYPGRAVFGKGAKNRHVTRLGRMLAAHGGGRFYREGPGPRWGEADRLATQAFQRAQGWTGADADGLPGRTTWNLLVKGGGKNIPAAGSATASGSRATASGIKGSKGIEGSTGGRTGAGGKSGRGSTGAATAGGAVPAASATPAAGTGGTTGVGTAGGATGTGSATGTGRVTGAGIPGSTDSAGSTGSTGSTGTVGGTGGPRRPSSPHGASRHGRPGGARGTGATAGHAAGPRAFPGAAFFRPGRSGPEVRRLGEQLVRKGFGRYYTSGPGLRWSEADRRNVQAFQRAQGWSGTAADGYPGPETWRRLFA